MKTTMPDHVMDRIADITQSSLKSQGIFHIRNGHKFILKMSDQGKLLALQSDATEQLMSEGVITPEMVSEGIAKIFKND